MTATSKTYDDKLIAIEKRFEPLEAKIGEVGKLPHWLIAVILGIGINVGAVAIEHYSPFGNGATVSTTTTSSYQTHH